MVWAYADPPYPGLARRYYGTAEVDHAALVSRLQRFDAWALSTAADSLPWLLELCREAGIGDVLVGAWFRGERPGAATLPRSAWEPVIYCGARPLDPSPRARRDALTLIARPRLTDPAREIGQKPAGFWWWLFELMGARAGDTFEDLFPASGGGARAWEAWTREASRLEDRQEGTRELELASREHERGNDG